MSKAPKQRTSRNVPIRQKLAAIRRVQSGESKASVARDLGAPESTLRGWCKNQHKIIMLARQSGEELEPMFERMAISAASQSTSSPSPPCDVSTSSSSMQLSPTTEYNIFASESPLDLQVRNRRSTPEPPRVPSASCHSESERSNRDELARLSRELGLDAPEMFNSGVPGSPNSSRTPIVSNGIPVQWQHLLTQQNQFVRHMESNISTCLNGARISGGSVADSNNARMSPPSPSRPMPNATISVNDSANGRSNSTSPPNVATTSSSTRSPSVAVASMSIPFTSASIPMSTIDPALTSDPIFWNWYNSIIANQLACSISASLASAPYSTPTTSVSDKRTLYQNVTRRNKVHKAEDLSNKASLPDDKPEPRNIQNSRARAVLDTLLNNTPGPSNAQSSEEAPSLDEAVIYGQQFLRWLETCSEPTITAMQLMQFRSLLKNVIQSAERKNGDANQKSKRK